MENEMADLPFSQVLEEEIQGWQKFRRTLRKEDQQFFDRLFEKARLHVKAGSKASRPWLFETILISILVEQEKEMVELRSRVSSMEKGRGDGVFRRGLQFPGGGPPEVLPGEGGLGPGSG